MITITSDDIRSVRSFEPFPFNALTCYHAWATLALTFTLRTKKQKEHIQAMAHAKITWFGGKQFAAVDSSKHSVVLSAQDEANSTGMKPSDMLLVALAGCSAVDVVGILQKKRQDLSGFEINIQGEQDQDPPWAFRRIEIEYVVSGREIKEKAVADAIRLSKDKYCSVSATVSGVAEIVTRFRIVEV
jgi:putative redox protein